MQIAKWEAADALFNLDADLFSNTLKLRQAGYEGARLDTKTNFYERFEEMADRCVHCLPRTFSCSGGHASSAAAGRYASCYCTPVASCQAQSPARQSVAAQLPPWSATALSTPDRVSDADELRQCVPWVQENHSPLQQEAGAQGPSGPQHRVHQDFPAQDREVKSVCPCIMSELTERTSLDKDIAGCYVRHASLCGGLHI